MTKELDEVREIFLTEVDEETRLDNEKKIEEWEIGLRTHEAMADWQDHDITKQIIAKAKEACKDIAFTLANDRRLTEEQRMTLWGRQDACLFLLGLAGEDAKARIAQIQKEIKTALNATN